MTAEFDEKIRRDYADWVSQLPANKPLNPFEAFKAAARLYAAYESVVPSETAEIESKPLELPKTD